MFNSRKYKDWISIFNISIPFNIILKHQNLYLKQVIEYSDDLTYAGMMNTDIAEFKNSVFTFNFRRKNLKTNWKYLQIF